MQLLTKLHNELDEGKPTAASEHGPAEIVIVGTNRKPALICGRNHTQPSPTLLLYLLVSAKAD